MAIDDALNRNPRKNSFGDAAAAMSDPNVTPVTATARERLISQIPGNGAAPVSASTPNSRSNPLDNEVGRNVLNTLTALPGVGGIVPRVGGSVAQAASRALSTERVLPAAWEVVQEGGALTKSGSGAAQQLGQIGGGRGDAIARAAGFAPQTQPVGLSGRATQALNSPLQGGQLAQRASTQVGEAAAGLAPRAPGATQWADVVQPAALAAPQAAQSAAGANAAPYAAGAGLGAAALLAGSTNPNAVQPPAQTSAAAAKPNFFPGNSPDAGKNIYAGFGFGKGGEQQAAGAAPQVTTPDPMAAHNQKLEAAQGLQSWRQSPGTSSSPAARQNYLDLQQKAVDMQPSYFAQQGPMAAQARAAAESAASSALQSMYTQKPPAAASAPASNPYASVTPEQGRDMAEINAKAQSPVAAAPSAKQQLGLPPVQQPGGYDPNQSRPDLGYGPIGDRTKLTNEQAAIMNPAGRVTMTRGANGNMEFSGNNVSGQVSYNDANGKAFAGGGLPMPGGGSQGFANFSVAPAGADVATGPNGSYAYATSGSGVRGQGGSAGSDSGRTADGIDVRGLRGPQADRYAAEVRQAQATNAAAGQHARTVQNRMDQEKNLRKLDIKVSSAGSRIERMAAQKAYNEALAQDAGFRAGADAGSVARTQNEGATARERMQQTGATERAQAQEAGTNARFGQTQGLAQQKFGMEQEAQGFSRRAAAQQEQLRNVLLDPNATQEQKDAARQSMQLFSGPSEQWKAIATSGGKDELGNTLPGGALLYNPATGESRPAGGQQQASASPYKDGQELRGKDGKTYVVKNGLPVLK